MRGALVSAGVGVGLLAMSPAPSLGVDLHKSLLTAIELKKCEQIRKHKDGGAWRCPGIRGYPVYFAEGDLRQMLAFGPSPERRRSATQTLGPFNTIFDGKRRPTIEWRVEQLLNGRIAPFATIVRFHTSNEGAKGEALVITKVDAVQSCHVAVIDALANPDAMAMARTWAIGEARKRTCPDTPEVLGVKGRSPM